jgi:nicotinamidase-related amidase
MSAARLRREDAALVIVDVQEGFRKAVPGFDDVAARTAVLAQGAAVLVVPVLVTEQYPRGLGDTVPEVLAALGDAPRLPKTVFSAARAEGFDLAGRGQALVCGVEAHVCVAQTVLDLLERGVDVQVAADATASRSARDRDAALRRLEVAGATVTTVEAALFELLGAAGTPEFKAVQELIK